MSKKDFAPVEGLEEVAMDATSETAEQKEAKVKKVQTPEEKEVLVAGVDQMRSIGVSTKLSKVLDLVAVWNDGDKEALAATKEAVIKEFGTSEDLKNYIDGDFQSDVQAWSGIAKAMPVLNNIKAFYARRESTGVKKVKTVQVSIAGTIYNVSVDYNTEIAALPAAERKQLLLAHPATKKVELAEEII
jgi:hypothetical protein